MHKNLTITAILGALTIAFGAFGAHALKDVLTVAGLNSFETAVRYQFYHVLVLLFVNSYSGFSEARRKQISNLFFLGILAFSGSIYAIQLAGVSAKSIWFVTPLGGLLFIAGWTLMVFTFLKSSGKTK